MTDKVMLNTNISIIIMTCTIVFAVIMSFILIEIYQQRKVNRRRLDRIQLPMEREIAIGNDVYGVGSKFMYHPGNGMVHHCVVTSIGSIRMTLENEIQSYCIEIHDFQRFFRSGQFRKYSISDGPAKYVMKHKFI